MSGLLVILTFVLILAKACGWINIPWVVVFLPVVIPLMLIAWVVSMIM